MSILILNCERDEVGGQYLVASIHGVEHWAAAKTECNT